MKNKQSVHLREAQWRFITSKTFGLSTFFAKQEVFKVPKGSACIISVLWQIPLIRPDRLYHWVSEWKTITKFMSSDLNSIILLLEDPFNGWKNERLFPFYSTPLVHVNLKTNTDYSIYLKIYQRFTLILQRLHNFSSSAWMAHWKYQNISTSTLC